MMTHGNNDYEVEYLKSVVKKDIPALKKKKKTLIKKAIEERLAKDPVGFGKPLRYSLKGHRRLRVADYRIVFKIQPLEYKVIIVAIKHRKEVYEAF